LLEILRDIAIANQQEEPQVFYPIREVASHLGVPVSTVSRIYNALEEEGIRKNIYPRRDDHRATYPRTHRQKSEPSAEPIRSSDNRAGKLVAVDSNFSAAVAAVRFSAQEVVGDIT
jgi:DNA-binding Lrp family transcriptional regulator